MVFADAEKVTRVLVNLVVNAIKFSPEGSRIILSATSQDTGDVQISVTDHGAGVSPENVALIFKRFRQVGHVTGGTKGFGLGLNIAKELVALNLGQMSVASELKKGSTFSFTVPVNDPRIILARLFEHLENIHTTLGRIALLRIRPQDSGRDVTLDELRGFLACSSHAGDVIMDTSDGNALIIFGYSVNPGAWLRRLVKAGGDIQQFTPGQKLCPFAVELVDSLPYPIDLAAATSMILRYTKMETACD
jgi:anti-sigma regulatory factor (Ser/Thr protein kinase)